MTKERALQMIEAYLRDEKPDAQWVECLKLCAQELKKIPQSHKGKREWISVKDSLPEKYMGVIVFTESGHMHQGWRSYATCEWRSPFGEIHGVTHWMPFPVGPEEV